MYAFWLKIRKAAATVAAFLVLLAGAVLYGRKTGAADEREETLKDDLKAAEDREQARRNENTKVKEVEREVDQMDDATVDAELDQWMREKRDR